MLSSRPHDDYRQQMKSSQIFLIPVAALLLGFICLPTITWAAQQNKNRPEKVVEMMGEGKTTVGSVTAGPFFIDRKYKSMEGPYVDLNLTVGDIISGGNVIADEKFVVFTDRPSTGATPTLVLKKPDLPRSLFWLKGIKIEVIGEEEKPLPTTEFVCHMNLDTDRAFRAKAFPEAKASETERLLCLTQGLDSITFPPGFGLPVASDEPWRIVMQAANRTSSGSRLVKHKLTFYFIKDSELIRPLKALTWSVPYISVVVDRDTRAAQETEKTNHPHCGISSSGVTAPNGGEGSVWTDNIGRKVSAHWVVPPGKHNYVNPVTVPEFGDKDRTIHLAWAHIHPLCTEFSLSSCADSKKVFEGKATTSTKNGLLLKKIDCISDAKGILLKGGKNYQLQATYDNTTGEAQDSMVSCGIFFADENFARPAWSLARKSATHCEVRPNSASGSCTSEAQQEINLEKAPQQINSEKAPQQISSVKAQEETSSPKTHEQISTTGTQAEKNNGRPD